MTDPKTTAEDRPRSIRQRMNVLYVRFLSLQGDPHYVAMGMAIGVFVAVTPTIPFHTVIALAMAFVLRASKPAAVIGVWFSNPLTIPPFYYCSYKLGMLMLGRELVCVSGEVTLRELLAQGLDVTVAMVLGGALLGIVPAVIFYFVTLVVFRKIRARHSQPRVDMNQNGQAPKPSSDSASSG